MSVSESSILLVDADYRFCTDVAAWSSADGVDVFHTPEVGLSTAFERRRPSVVVLAPVRRRTWDCLRVVRAVRRISARVPILLIVAESSEALAIAAFRTGVSEYLRGPLDRAPITRTIRRMPGSH